MMFHQVNYLLLTGVKFLQPIIRKENEIKKLLREKYFNF